MHVCENKKKLLKTMCGCVVRASLNIINIFATSVKFVDFYCFFITVFHSCGW